MNRSAPLALLLAVGCAEGLAEPDLLLPTEVSVEWDSAWNDADDGLGALVPVDVMVYDGATGEPIEGVDVLVTADDPGVVPVPVEGVLVVDDETDPDALWDASRDQYVAFRTTPDGAFDAELVSLASEDDADDELLDDLLLATDEGGIARLYLYVDAFPSADERGEFADITVVVAMNASGPDAERTFELVPR